VKRLQITSLSTFFIIMLGNTPQMFRAAAIALTSAQIKREDTVQRVQGVGFRV